MVLETFYQTVAQLSFTLLGLWFLVLQTKYQEWIGSPTDRRMVTSIALYFFVPGGMSLFALLSAPSLAVWRAAFAVAGCVGIVAVAVFLRDAARSADAKAERWRTWLEQAARVATLVLYAGIVVVALFLPARGAFGIQAFVLEGILVSLLVVLGLALAWAYFINPAHWRK